MKNKKSDLLLQRRAIEKKLIPWKPLMKEQIPRSGWIKAIRGSLGMTTAQLAERLDVDQPNVVRLEAREARGAVTLETLEKAARAMNCKLIYALVPDENYLSLDEILDERAEEVASEILKKVSHSMNLEEQGLELEDKVDQLNRMKKELKESVDPRLWRKK